MMLGLSSERVILAPACAKWEAIGIDKGLTGSHSHRDREVRHVGAAAARRSPSIVDGSCWWRSPRLRFSRQLREVGDRENRAQVRAKAPETALQHEVTVTLKLIQVFVTGADGKPALDLTKTDFVLTDNGKSQTITDFESHVLAVPAAERAVAVALPAPAPAPTGPAPLLSRKFIFLIDYVRNGLEGVQKAKAAALEFLDSKVGPDDEVAPVHAVSHERPDAPRVPDQRPRQDPGHDQKAARSSSEAAATCPAGTSRAWSSLTPRSLPATAATPAPPSAICSRTSRNGPRRCGRSPARRTSFCSPRASGTPSSVPAVSITCCSRRWPGRWPRPTRRSSRSIRRLKPCPAGMWRTSSLRGPWPNDRWLISPRRRAANILGGVNFSRPDRDGRPGRDRQLLCPRLLHPGRLGREVPRGQGRGPQAGVHGPRPARLLQSRPVREAHARRKAPPP